MIAENRVETLNRVTRTVPQCPVRNLSYESAQRCCTEEISTQLIR
jgi:hypothetical protein